MTKKTRWILVAALLATPALPVEAQRPPRPDRAGPAMVDRAAARALRLADELELTQDQRDALQELRSEATAALETIERERLAARQELRTLRREAQADEELASEAIRAFRDEARARMEVLRERERELTAPVLDRYQDILEAEQRLQLREMQRDRRVASGRPGARRAPARGGRMDRAGFRFRSRDVGFPGPRGRGGEGWWDRG